MMFDTSVIDAAIDAIIAFLDGLSQDALQSIEGDILQSLHDKCLTVINILIPVVDEPASADDLVNPDDSTDDSADINTDNATSDTSIG